MGVFTTVWIGLAGLVAATWLVRLVLMAPMLARRRPLTPRSHDPLPDDPPKVSVLVAAKDEQATVEKCITTLLAQDYPSIELIAINDRSTDRTGEILADLASRAPGRLSVLTIDRLPPGWYGKPHAMHEGMKRATGDWLLFTDADCVFDETRTISIALAVALRERTDFLTIIPTLKVETWWERILQPVCAIVLMYWFQPDKVNNPRSRTAYANGALMLMRREALDRIGGYEVVRNEINEDTRFARIAKRAGVSLRVEENVGLYHTRMYDTIRRAFRGWSRIFGGALARPPKVLLALLLLTLFSILPWLGLVVTLAIRHTLPAAGDWAIGLWAAAALLMQLTMWRLYAAVGFGKLCSLGYALGAVALVPVLLNATLISAGAAKTIWRNTTYRAGTVGTRSPGADVAVPANPADNAPP